jgi:hypothetical protein
MLYFTRLESRERERESTGDLSHIFDRGSSFVFAFSSKVLIVSTEIQLFLRTLH